MNAYVFSKNSKKSGKKLKKMYVFKFFSKTEAGHVLKMFLKNIPKRIHLTPAFFPKSMSQKDICGETKSCCSPEGEIGREA